MTLFRKLFGPSAKKREAQELARFDKVDAGLKRMSPVELAHCRADIAFTRYATVVAKGSDDDRAAMDVLYGASPLSSRTVDILNAASDKWAKNGLDAGHMRKQSDPNSPAHIVYSAIAEGMPFWVLSVRAAANRRFYPIIRSIWLRLEAADKPTYDAIATEFDRLDALNPDRPFRDAIIGMQSFGPPVALMHADEDLHFLPADR